MKLKSAIFLLSVLAAISAQGKGLYYIPNESEETFPIEWGVGMNVTWDDNTTPATAGPKDETLSFNPYVEMSFVSGSPQTVWDVYAKLGVLYYFDEPAAAGSDDAYGQMRVGVNLTHRFDERLRLVSRNFISYELEPDYSYGFATNRQSSEYLYWDTDNSLGYRWTERLATYTGLKLTMLDYANVSDADRFTWTLYNQFRYVLSPQTVGTAAIRYAQTTADGVASDSSDIYLLVGAEHRFTPNTILIANVGAQIRDVDGPNGGNSTSPYMELTLRTQVNEQFSISAFLRYGAEVYDTVVALPLLAEYDSRMTLRIGTQATYQVSQKLSLFSGIDLISTSFEDGRAVVGGAPQSDQDETLINAYIGANLELTEYLDGTISYNFTNADSDIPNRSYDRNRISVGLKAEF
ncbi:MAG: outer membrane beta-barrel protein [Verrucomicrobiota bacterium]